MLDKIFQEANKYNISVNNLLYAKVQYKLNLELSGTNLENKVSIMNTGSELVVSGKHNYLPDLRCKITLSLAEISIESLLPLKSINYYVSHKKHTKLAGLNTSIPMNIVGLRKDFGKKINLLLTNTPLHLSMTEIRNIRRGYDNFPKCFLYCNVPISNITQAAKTIEATLNKLIIISQELFNHCGKYFTY